MGFTSSVSLLTRSLGIDLPLSRVLADVLLLGATLTAAPFAHELMSRRARGEMRSAILSGRIADKELIKDPRDLWTAAAHDIRSAYFTPLGRSPRLGRGHAAALLLASVALGVLATIPIAPPDGTSPLSDPRIVTVTALLVAAMSLALVTSYRRQGQFPKTRASWPTAEELTPHPRNTTPD